MSWEIKKLNECCISIADGDHLPPPKSETGVPFVTIANVDSYNHFDFTDTMFVPQSYYDKLDDKRKARKGDILLTVVGSFGIPILITDDTPFVFQRHIAILRPNPAVIDSRFLYYTMMSKSFYAQADAYAIGAAQRTISLTSLRQMKVAVPDLETQRKIADVLAHLDSLIDSNNSQIKLLEQMAENLYKEWFVRFRFPGHENTEFENGIPKGWEIKKLFDVANVKYGYAFKSDLFCDDETLNPVVRIRDIPNNKTNTYTTEQCDERYLISENSIIIGMDGIFHMCLWNGGKAYLNQRVVEIESKNSNLSNLHLYYVIYPQVKYWEQTISGTTVAHLGDKHLKKMSVILPTEDICKEAKDVFDSMMLQKSKLIKQTENLKKQRDLLLPRLMSDKLEV